jgi:hypothetical protein
MSLMVTDNLAYWHMPKTGGMSVYRVLNQLGKRPQRITQGTEGSVRRHGPVSQIPQGALAKRALFGTVRDPWSWYTSLYQHATNDEDGIARCEQMGNGDGSFKAVLRGLTDPSTVKEMPEMWGLVLAYEEHNLADWQASGLGLCSWMFRYTYGRPLKPDLFIDTAGLYDGLAEIMNVPSERVYAVTPQNRSAHRPKSHITDPIDLYDDEARAWVAEADAPLIKTFGYEPFARPEWTVLTTSELKLENGLR